MTKPSDAHIERALDLPSRTLQQGREQGPSPELRALLRLVETFPWLLEVADENYGEEAARAILLRQVTVTFQEAPEAAVPTPEAAPATDFDIPGPDEDFQQEPDLGPARVVAKAPDRPGLVHLWTDGACSGNPGPMGIGVVMLDPLAATAPTRRREISVFLGSGTNNVAELTAIEHALRETDPERPAAVYTDSAYAIGVLARGWTASANQELVARVRDRIARHREVYFVKVKGHCGIADNERCDALARQAVSRGR